MSERPASYTVERPCMFCGAVTDHIGIDGDYDVNCGSCGTMYRVESGYYVEAMAGRKPQGRIANFQANAQAANREGFRLAIPGGERVPLE